MGDFSNKVAVVTGGASGIGKATAQQLTEKGAVVIILDFNQPLGELLIAELGDRSVFFKVDIADPIAVEKVFVSIAKQYPSVDVLVNCAGISSTQLPLADYPIDDWHNAININLNGSFYAMKYAIPLMPNPSAIVNLSSIMGQVSNPGGAAYAASKHAVIGLTKAAAQDYGAQGIRVNAVGPGIIDTPMTAAVMNNEAVIAAMHAVTPLGRFGIAEEVAALIVFLCSDQASFITGAYYPIDGGFLTH